MLASLVSVALALMVHVVGASRTLDESYYCNKFCT